MLINKVELCGVNTAKLPVLSSEEKKSLFNRILQGDLAAREQFIQGNLRLVLSVIQRFNNRGEPADDLFQVGCIGLIKAIDNFDVTQEVQFSTYAVPMIIGEVRRYLRDNNAIRVSRSLRDLAYKAMQMREDLFNKNNKEPTINELAKELGVDREELAMAIDSVQDTVSMFEPIFQDGTDTVCVMDQIRDNENIDSTWEQTITINEAMKKLPEREQMIINLRFFEGRTQTEIAEEIGISQAQISRLEKNALKHLRKFV
ncbi:MAG: RNA polymerase sporulation sigma factor SigG [Clostridia bacterium]|jgi:RNA polymerase sporulation-specific sigma factor|nr:RNA polymerase sporulation sigma factor SigG [Clostridia bacterium]